VSRVAATVIRPSAPPRAGRLLRVAGAGAIVAAAGLLVLRPAGAFTSLRSPAFLGLAYVLMLSTGALVSHLGGRHEAPAGAGTSTACLAAGLGAVMLARFVVAPAPPMAAATVGIGLSVLAAVAEEALFRGGLFRLLEGRGMALAVAGSALAFALVHVPAYGWRAFPVDLGAGLLFSWQRLTTGRWSVPAATHAAANLLAVMR
jgi:membrane protease YdiL (CAAX protease family)